MRQEGRSPFIGREQELAAAERALGRARAGISALVTILGDGGMGKTRLAEEVVARAEGFLVAWGSGWPDAGAPPLWPWQAVLDQLGAASAVELLDQHEAKTEPERFARFRAVSQAVGVVAAGRPVAIVLDDAHHVDAGALLLARFVVRTLRNAPLLVIVASRPHAGATADTLAEAARDGILVDLAGLDVDEVGALVASAGGGGPDRLGPALHALTAGNPFLLHEALAGSDNDLAILARAGRRLEERLAQFDPAALRILGAAAIVGSTTDPAFIGDVAGVPAAALRATQDIAVREGVLRPPPAEPFTFAHDLLREAVLDRLGPRDQAELHGRAAEALSSGEAPVSSDRAARVAHHRLAAADVNDPVAVAAAVEACRAAARVYLDGLAYEAAAGVLADACGLLERAGGTPSAELLVEHARAELAGGRLAAARTSFLAAVTGTTAIEPAVLAEAALGLGGIWVAEHRAIDARTRFQSLLARAARELGDGEPELRARLDARIAAEDLYVGAGSIGAMLATVDAARRLDDPLPLAHALSLLHNVLLGPASAGPRLAIAEELATVASAAGDAVLTLMGVLWRTVDLLLAGDPAADRSLLELRQRADGLRVEAVVFVVAVIDVMRATRAGRLDDAEGAAARALELGLAAGDVDAVNYYAAHLLAIRWLQDRSSDVLPLARDALDTPTMVAGDPVFAAALAALAADAGGPALEEAQRELDRLVEAGLDTIPLSSNWMATMFCVVEAASVLDDVSAARAAYDLLLPYADLPVMASIAVVCFGPVARVLGKAAVVLGRIDDAIGHLEHAEAVARRIGNRPYLALSRAELGAALLARGRPRRCRSRPVVARRRRQRVAPPRPRRQGRPHRRRPGLDRHRSAGRRARWHLRLRGGLLGPGRRRGAGEGRRRRRDALPRPAARRARLRLRRRRAGRYRRGHGAPRGRRRDGAGDLPPPRRHAPGRGGRGRPARRRGAVRGRPSRARRAARAPRHRRGPRGSSPCLRRRAANGPGPRSRRRSVAAWRPSRPRPPSSASTSPGARTPASCAASTPSTRSRHGGR